MFIVIDAVEADTQLLTHGGTHAVGAHQQIAADGFHVRPLAQPGANPCPILGKIEQFRATDQFASLAAVTLGEDAFHIGLGAAQHPGVRGIQAGQIQLEQEALVTIDRHCPHGARGLADRCQHFKGGKNFQAAGMQPQRPGPGRWLREPINNAAINAVSTQADPQHQAGGASANNQDLRCAVTGNADVTLSSG